MKSRFVVLTGIFLSLLSSLVQAEQTYVLDEVRPLGEQERLLNAFSGGFHDRLDFKDGILYRNGRPYFLFGSVIGGGQWGPRLMFWPRVMGNNQVTLDGSVTRHLYNTFEDGKVVVAWETVPFWKSMANEAARNRLFSYIDLGGGIAENLAAISRALKEHRLAGAEDWLDLANPYFGHFYPIDVNSGLGQEFYLNGFRSFLRYLGGDDVPLAGVELRNELGVYTFSPEALAAFRKYLETKYGDLGVLNRVCRTRFRSFQEIFPPFLRDAEFMFRADEASFRGSWSRWTKKIAEAKEAYPELSHDWVEFTRARFVDGCTRLIERFRQEYGTTFPINIQERLERVPTDWYQTVDIEQLADHLDFFGQQISNPLFFHYQGRPADPETVKEAMNRLTLFPDFGRGIFKKTIINTECIVEGSFPADKTTEQVVGKSLVPLQTAWRYRADPDQAGEKAGWFAPGFDDASWSKVQVPNLEQPNEARKNLGRSWYRISFPLAADYLRRRDYDFKKFVLYGGGLDDSGRIWLNGQLVFAGGASREEYLVDLSDRLNYGGRNTLAIAIDNDRGTGGIRGPLALVDSQDLRVKRPISDGQTAALFWQHAVHGHSGVNFWQTKQPAINPEIIRTRLAMESVADVLLPQPRIRGKVAVLYPFESFDGLVRSLEDLPEFPQFMNVYAGLIFNHIPVDVLSCRGILRGEHARYPLVVAPMARMVRQGVFEQFTRYVESGGTLLLTPDSLVRDDHFYENLPLERLIGAESADASRQRRATPSRTVRRLGKGRVYYLGDVSQFYATHRALREILGNLSLSGDVELTFQKNEEFPFVEAQRIGDGSRLLVYLMNWGAAEQAATLKLSAALVGQDERSYTVRSVRDAAMLGGGNYTSRQLREGLSVRIRPQDPLVLLFESGQGEPLKLRRPANERMAVLRRLDEMRKDAPLDAARPSVLFLKVRGEVQLDQGKAGSPILVDLLEKGGCGVYERFVSELSAEELRRFGAVFIDEDYVGMWKEIGQTRPEFYAMLHDYVEQGGSLFVAGTVHAGWNATSAALNAILKPEGISTPPRYPRNRVVWFEDPAHCDFHDPLDVVFTDIRPHPITQGVRSVHLFCATPLLDRGHRLTPLVFSGAEDLNFPGQATIAAGTIGKGRVVVSGEPCFLQPFRIEAGDNLKLAWNSMRWLLGDRLPDLSQEDLAARLLFRERDVEHWEAEEGLFAGRGAEAERPAGGR